MMRKLAVVADCAVEEAVNTGAMAHPLETIKMINKSVESAHKQDKARTKLMRMEAAAAVGQEHARVLALEKLKAEKERDMEQLHELLTRTAKELEVASAQKFTVDKEKDGIAADLSTARNVLRKLMKENADMKRALSALSTSAPRTVAAGFSFGSAGITAPLAQDIVAQNLNHDQGLAENVRPPMNAKDDVAMARRLGAKETAKPTTATATTTTVKEAGRVKRLRKDLTKSSKSAGVPTVIGEAPTVNISPCRGMQDRVGVPPGVSAPAVEVVNRIRKRKN